MPTCHLETPVMQQNRARLPLQDHLLFIQGGRTFLSAMQFKRTISPVTSRETGNEAGAKTCALFGVHCCFMGMGHCGVSKSNGGQECPPSFGIRTHTIGFSSRPESKNPAFAGFAAERVGLIRACRPSPLRGGLAFARRRNGVAVFEPKRLGSHPALKAKTPLSRGLLRRGWDSNPRYDCSHNGFRDRPIQPLSHLSVCCRKIMTATTWI